MKSLFTKILFISGIFSLYTDAQILNGDFEQWSGGEPVYWYSSNDPM